MSVIFNIRVSSDKENVNVTVHRNGEAHKFSLKSPIFIALFESEEIYTNIVEWFGGVDNLPELESEIYTNIAKVYNFLKYESNSQEEHPQKRGLVKRALLGIIRPSIIPQALIPHRVSPFADSDIVWKTWIQTKPYIDQAKKEEQRLQALQSAQESVYLNSEDSSLFKSKFEALMAFRGVSKKQVKRSFFVNLLLAFSFLGFGLFQVYLFTRLLLGLETSILNLPVVGVFSYIAWPLSIMVMIYCFMIALIRLWYCTLINKRLLEQEYPFKKFIKSGSYFPGDFKEFGEQDV